jgi:hypothetical protein
MNVIPERKEVAPVCNINTEELAPAGEKRKIVDYLATTQNTNARRIYLRGFGSCSGEMDVDSDPIHPIVSYRLLFG